MLEVVRQGLEKFLPVELVSELLDAYQETKNNYYLGKFRPNEVGGGRFAEVVFRILESHAFGGYTAIGKQLNTEVIIRNLQQISFGDQPESIRLHIPRTLRLIYDIRSKRDAVHLADGIDPNSQDATFVVAACDWVLAELVRLYHSVSAQEAQSIVESIVERKVLVVQDFDGFLKTLNPDFSSQERILVVLYQRGKQGASVKEITSWLKPSQRANVRRALTQLEHEKDQIVSGGDLFRITNLGMQFVEERGFLIPR